MCRFANNLNLSQKKSNFDIILKIGHHTIAPIELKAVKVAFLMSRVA